MNQGWAWLGLQGFPQRGIVRLRNLNNGKHVFCEMLHIDSNYIHRYNQARRKTIVTPQAAIVLNEWYRTRLDISKGAEVDLDVISANTAFGRLRASLTHPQIVVRLATHLALWSVVLGAVGLVFGAIGYYFGLDEPVQMTI